MNNCQLFPVFLDSSLGRIFLLHRQAPSSGSQKGMLVIPPFADEMNKSRHMLNLLSKRVCNEGYHVVFPDLFGTGDSQGQYKDANWDVWSSDIEAGIRYLEEQGVKEISIFAMRTGALLAADLVSRFPGKFIKLVLWQPVIDGNMFLNQFLRLRLASSMMSGDGEKETTKGLMAKFENGETVEIAGYQISPDLALTLQKKYLKDYVDSLPDVVWLDIVSSDDREPPSINKKLVQTLRDANVNVIHDKCSGEVFWTSVEIVELPALIDKTISCLQ